MRQARAKRDQEAIEMFRMKLYPVAMLLLLFLPLLVDAGGTPLSTRRVVSGVSRPVLVTAPTADFERLFINIIVSKIIASSLKSEPYVYDNSL